MQEIGSPTVKVARGVVYTYFQNIVGILTTLVYFPILVRVLSREEVGVVVTLGMILTLALTLNSFSIPKAVTKYVAEYMGRRRFGAVRGLHKRSMQLSLCLGVASAVALLLLSSMFFPYLHPIGLLPQLVTLLSIHIIISTVSGFLSSLLYGLQKFRDMAIIGVISNILTVGSAIVLLYLGYGVVGVIAGWIIGQLTGLALNFFFTQKAVKAFTGEDDGVTTSRLFEYSLPLYAMSVIDYLSTYTDRFLLLGLMGLSGLAVYSGAATVFSFLVTAIYPISYVLFPSFSEFYGKNSNKSLQIASLRATRYISLIFVPMAVGLATVSYPAIVMFAGAGYVEATLPLAILCLTIAFTQVGVPGVSTLLSLGKTRALLDSEVLGLVANAIIVLILVQPMGINGVALGRAGYMITGFGYVVYTLKRSHGFHVDKEAFTKAWISSLTMAIIVFITQSYFLFDIRLMPLYILLGLISYIVTIRWLKVVNNEDSLLFKSLPPRRFKKASGLFTILFGIKSSHPKEALKRETDDFLVRLKTLEIREFFDKESSNLDSYIAGNPILDYEQRRRHEAVMELLNVKEGNMILDVGCGNFRDITPLARQGFNCVGVDISKRMIQTGKRKLNDIGLQNVELIMGSATSLPLKDRTFDRVICSEVIEHIPRWDIAISEIVRCLSDDGILVITTPNKESLYGAYRKFLELRNKKTSHPHPYDQWKTQREVVYMLGSKSIWILKKIGICFIPSHFTYKLSYSRKRLCVKLTWNIERKIRYILHNRGYMIGVSGIKRKVARRS